MRKQLEYVDYVYTEINTSDVYKDCAHVVDLDQFLGGFGFSRVATKETNEGWGDAFYSRKNKSLLAARLREPLGNEPQKSTQSCNLFRLNNLRESEAGLTLFHRFRS